MCIALGGEPFSALPRHPAQPRRHPELPAGGGAGVAAAVVVAAHLWPALEHIDGDVGR